MRTLRRTSRAVAVLALSWAAGASLVASYVVAGQEPIFAGLFVLFATICLSTLWSLV